MIARVVCALALGLCACGDARPRARDAAVARPTATPPAGHGLTVERLPAVEPEARVIAIVGNGGVVSPLPRDAQAVLPRGGAIEAGQTGIVVDVGRSGRVTIGAGAKIELGELDEAELVVREGLLTVSQPVEGNSSRPALRVATPSGTVVLTSGGEALVAVARNGKAFVALWSGSIEVRDGAVLADGSIARPRLLVGSGWDVLGGALDEALPVGDGAALEAAFRARAARFVASEAGARRCEPEADAARARLDALEDVRASLAALRARHAALVQARSSEAADVSRRIVAETQSVMRQREGTLVALERAHACAASKPESAVTPLVPRAREALAPPGRRP